MGTNYYWVTNKVCAECGCDHEATSCLHHVCVYGEQVVIDGALVPNAPTVTEFLTGGVL